MSRVDFYYDYSSPFAYLGSTRIEPLARRAGAELVWCPMLLGGLFKHLGAPMVPLFHASKQKQSYLMADMRRWANWFDVDFTWPTRFPMNTVMPLRLTLLLSNPTPFIHRVFKAYWAEDKDIDDPTELARILTSIGEDPDLVHRTREPEVKQLLIAATEQATDAGVFGAPTCIVHNGDNTHLFWGQDRFNFVEKALRGWNPD